MAVRRDARCALIGVGLQNDLAHPEGFFHRQGLLRLPETERAGVVANVARVASSFRTAGWPVVHAQWQLRPDHLDAAYGVPWQRLGLAEAGALVKGKARVRQRPLPPGVSNKIVGTWGAQIIDELAPAVDEPVVVKKNQSAFWFTPLDRLLRRLGVQTCITVGGAAGGCLNDTVREGVGYGYTFQVVTDAVYPAASAVLDSLRGRATLVRTDEVLG